MIHSRLNLTNCKVVTTTARRMSSNDPQRRNENEPLFLLRKISPNVLNRYWIRKVGEMIPRMVLICI
jgi:hypothetical protein